MKIKTKNKLDEGRLFKISRFKEIIKKTVPHKHEEYYELIFLQAGEGFHWIESEKYQIGTPEFYFLKPGQVHFWQFTSVPKGFVVLFKTDFFDSIKESRLKELFKKMGGTPHLSIQQQDPFVFILEEILNEYGRATPYANQIIHGYLKVLFSKILQIAENNWTIPSVTNSLYDRFLELLYRECPGLHQVNDYARLLNTTPQNLNAACRKNSDRSAGAHIDAQLLLEAKRYILYTEGSINEIADILGFNDASYFIKFFKKNEGVTPLKFRSKYFQ